MVNVTPRGLNPFWHERMPYPKGRPGSDVRATHRVLSVEPLTEINDFLPDVDGQGVAGPAGW